MIYGFLGAGNMASAIIRGMVKGGYKGSSINVYNITMAKSEALGRRMRRKRVPQPKRAY